MKLPEEQGCLKEWKPFQLPALYSPVNSLAIVKSHRILCHVKLSEGDSKTAENFAYFVIDFAQIKTTVKGEHILMFKGPLIGYNSKLGTFEGVLRFSIDQTKIEEANQTPGLIPEAQDKKRTPSPTPHFGF